MTKNPIINALGATLYITVVAMVMYYGGKQSEPVNSIVAPIAIISLFTFSAAIMGYIFLYQPFILYFDGKKKQAVRLFFYTILFFGLITFLTLALLFSGIIKSTKNEAVVGGDRDKHGCIGSAGYSWCEVKQKCLRPWEESCDK